MPQLKNKLEQFLSVTLRSSNTPRLLNIYVSFFCDVSFLRKLSGQVDFELIKPKSNRLIMQF